MPQNSPNRLDFPHFGQCPQEAVFMDGSLCYPKKDLMIRATAKYQKLNYFTLGIPNHKDFWITWLLQKLRQYKFWLAGSCLVVEMHRWVAATTRAALSRWFWLRFKEISQNVYQGGSSFFRANPCKVDFDRDFELVSQIFAGPKTRGAGLMRLSRFCPYIRLYVRLSPH